ncbi:MULTISPECIES: ribonuclease P protein component [Spirulina sp. CCY15215]|uniref:ribonuclease P protein component n=1 Tax=Spirulina sp. CCY15215 TaxID=2767591 RepID=UPI00194EF6A9
MGLPQANRLKHWRDFQEVYQRGKRYSGSYLTLRSLSVMPKSETGATEAEITLIPSTRIGISIGKKVSKKAVVRNRIKRQIRAAIREILPQMSGGWKLAIGVKSTATKCEYEHFLRELKQLLTRAEVLHGY